MSSSNGINNLMASLNSLTIAADEYPELPFTQVIHKKQNSQPKSLVGQVARARAGAVSASVPAPVKPVTYQVPAVRGGPFNTIGRQVKVPARDFQVSAARGDGTSLGVGAARGDGATIGVGAARGVELVSVNAVDGAMICRYCKATDHTIEICNKKCFVCGKFGHGHRRCPENTICNYCKATDHVIADCPRRCGTCGLFGRHHADCTVFCRYCKATTHNISQCQKKCHLCGLLGHRANHCPEKETRTPVCFHCKQEGHLQFQCTAAICEECGAVGHWRNTCPNNVPEGVFEKAGGTLRLQ